ncbi:hypothetical protein BC936DRAFT_147737 [Jimgerdemannia flammicorona]|uniref:Uncharacterized protein n=1 Tax=Jimgerdemannia flammicorona TaxID=994334 RepID=A0A433D4L6_9FUNG|nr:hypothetical protein BC936DRAFT_147737 [Jimgerdemannia flammicorona]
MADTKDILDIKERANETVNTEITEAPPRPKSPFFSHWAHQLSAGAHDADLRDLNSMRSASPSGFETFGAKIEGTFGENSLTEHFDEQEVYEARESLRRHVREDLEMAEDAIILG